MSFSSIIFDSGINVHAISCFPHVINLSVKAGLRRLTESSIDSDDEVDSDEESGVEMPAAISGGNDDRYMRALQYDVVAAARQLVTACRASGQRREDFASTIKEGNAAGSFGEDGLREVGLLRDMDIRWSASYLMIDRVLEVYPVRAAVLFSAG